MFKKYKARKDAKVKLIMENAERHRLRFENAYEIHEVGLLPNEAGFIYWVQTSKPGYYESVKMLCYWGCTHNEVQFTNGGEMRKIPRGTWGTWLDSCGKISQLVQDRETALREVRKQAHRWHRLNFPEKPFKEFLNV